MKSIILTIYIMIGFVLTGCQPEPFVPDQKPLIIFPTFNTGAIQYKQDLNITVYPIKAEGNTTAYVLKEYDYNAWKLKSKTDTKDFNSLLDSIKEFNIKLKEKEAEYNK